MVACTMDLDDALFAVHALDFGHDSAAVWAVTVAGRVPKALGRLSHARTLIRKAQEGSDYLTDPRFIVQNLEKCP